MFLIVDPFKGSNFESMGWLDYLFGALFLVAALITIPFMFKANRAMKVYKRKQLELYRKNSKNHFKSYEESKLFVPASKKMLYFLPVVLFITFVVIGMSFMVGHPITQL